MSAERRRRHQPEVSAAVRSAMIGQTPSGHRAVLAIEEVLRQGSQGQSGDHFPTGALFRHDPHANALLRVGNVNGAWGLGRL